MSQTREAPLDNHIDISILSNYMATLNVSPKKFVNNKHWQTYTNLEQEALLLKELNKVLTNKTYFNLIYRTELTKNGMKHLHFTLETSEVVMQDIQFQFHKKFGMPNLEPSVCCKYEKTIVSRSYAEEYVTKEDEQSEDECLFRKKNL